MSNNVQADSKKHELEGIKGLGEKSREALVKGGVQTLVDLADSSVDEIESILKDSLYKDKKIPSNVDPKQWIRDAVSQTAPPEFTVFFNYGDINDGQQKRWRALIHPHEDLQKPEPSQWLLKPDDQGYTVRFERISSEDNEKHWRTIVYNGKSLEEEDITGWTPVKWWTWIVKKASLTEKALQVTARRDKDLEPMPPPVDDKPAVAEESQVEKDLKITRFEVHFPSEERKNTLIADVDFEISEELLAQYPRQIQVEVFYVNLENNFTYLAGYDSKYLKSEQRKYEIRIEFPLPELGRYKPHCVVLLLPSGEHKDYQENNIFKVVPPKI